MAVNVNEILTKTWSMRVSSFGDIVADIEDLKQSVMLIILTVKGTVPLWAEFGCGLYDYIDQPVNLAGPLMVREIRNAVERWETRATLSNISFEIKGSSIFFNLSLQTSLRSDTDPSGMLFIGFELDSVSSTIYLIDQFGRRIVTQLGPIKLKK